MVGGSERAAGNGAASQGGGGGGLQNGGGGRKGKKRTGKDRLSSAMKFKYNSIFPPISIFIRFPLYFLLNFDLLGKYWGCKRIILRLRDCLPVFWRVIDNFLESDREFFGSVRRRF